MDDLPAIMKTAKEYQNQGRLDEAEAIYLKILEIDGSNAEAFHLLGLICHAREILMSRQRPLVLPLSSTLALPNFMPIYQRLNYRGVNRLWRIAMPGVPSNWIPP